MDRKAAQAYRVSAQSWLWPRWLWCALAQSWQGCGCPLVLWDMDWKGSWSLSSLIDQHKHILYNLLPLSYYAQAVVTPSYVTRDSECHSTSLSPVVLLWFPPRRGGNVLYLGSYVFSWVLSQDGAEEGNSSAEKQSPYTISRILYIAFVLLINGSWQWTVASGEQNQQGTHWGLKSCQGSFILTQYF